MSRASHLLRRPSGVYVVRFVVPARLRTLVGKTEIHRSTGSHEQGVAKIVAHELAAQWHHQLERLGRMDISKLRAGSVDLLGDGTVALVTAAEKLGAQVSDLTQRLLTRGKPFLVASRGWQGWLMQELADLEPGYDAAGFVDSVVLNRETLERKGSPVSAPPLLALKFDDDVLAIVGATTPHHVTVFRYVGAPELFALECPGVEVGLHSILVRRADIEALRSSLVAALPAVALVVGPTGDGPEVLAMFDSIAKPKYAGRKVSDLTAAYLAARTTDWGEDELGRQRDACSALVELTDDLRLGDVDREVLRKVAERLSKVPNRRDLLRRSKDGGGLTTWRQLIAHADRHGGKLMTPTTVMRIVEDMQSVFAWGETQGWLRENPAKKLAAEVFGQLGGKRVLAHLRRDPFTDDDLATVFGADWYRNGKGSRTAGGSYFAYRPHYYWLPLLAIYVGGRINELSQLYLSDVREAEGHVWYLDFNLDAEDKVDADDEDIGEDDSSTGTNGGGGKKRLKTTNAMRVVPIHPVLIELGLLKYVDALRAEGHARLFPELKCNVRKGYGKAAGAWFNDRYLGKQLKIPRNGRKVFHSFRHNFQTLLERAGAPDRAIKQLVGHALQSLHGRDTAPGYIKQRTVTELAPVIALLSPRLPTIAPFNVDEGLEAVQDAIKLKGSRRPAAARSPKSR